MKHLLIFAAVALLLTACKKNEHDDRIEGAHQLYLKLAELTRNYTDSINNASDTTDISAIYERYEKAYDNLNNNVAPDTDLFMKEGENDTIVILQRALLSARDKRLSAHDVHLTTDTVKLETEP